MIIGIPTEVKDDEYRVAITPAGVKELTWRGHDVLVQKDAGLGSSISNDDFVATGARIIDEADDVWAESDLVLKVKEPVAIELEAAIEDCLPGSPTLGEPEVLHEHQLSWGEAVVHLGHRQLRHRIGDAGLRVGIARRCLALREVGVVVLGVTQACA